MSASDEYNAMGNEDYWLALPPKARAFALVGFYLHAWSTMENQLNKCIAAALDLSDLQSVVVTRNITLHGKLGMLKAIVNFLYKEDSDEEIAFNKLLVDIGNAARSERNVAAHDMFGEDKEGDGVSFHVTKGKNKISFPDIRWSIKDTLQKSVAIIGHMQGLESLQSDLEKSDSSIVRAAFRHSTRDIHAPSLAELLSHPPQDTPHSDAD